MPDNIPIKDQQPPYRLFIRNNMCPGDALVASAAVESLHRNYPGQFLTNIQTCAQAIWEHNPRISNIPANQCHVIDLAYPAIHDLSRRQVHFMNGYCENLGRQLNRPCPLQVRHPMLYLNEDERTRRLVGTENIGDYCVINAGHKDDFTAKFAGSAIWQRVVDHFRDRLTFVQVGEENPTHHHKRLDGVVDLVGKTPNYRDLFRLCRHSVAGCGPVSLLLHVYGAFEMPYVALAGGRESTTWEAYETTHYLHCFGSLECAKLGGCWKSRTVPLGDGSKEDGSLCSLPVIQNGETIPKCLSMIGAEGVVDSLERILKGRV